VNDTTLGGDARTDIYLMTPPGLPDFKGGAATTDTVAYPDPLVRSGYIFMSPGMTRQSFRFRAAHEFMHVIQGAYIETRGMLTEATANWAAEHALPDVDPLDSQFPAPWAPLDCFAESWEDTQCGLGYAQWLFYERLTQRYGVGFMDRLWTRYRTECAACAINTTPAQGRQIVSHAIDAEPGDATLASSYVDYAAALWDPTKWDTTVVESLHKISPPASFDADLSRSAPSTGVHSIAVDHLATRFVRIRQTGASAPGDAVHVTTTSALATVPQLLSGAGPGRARTATPLTPLGGGNFEATVSLDGGGVTDVVLQLSNDTTSDDAPFVWKADLVAGGAPTPPSNDLRANPLRVLPQTTTTVDVAYAGGLGVDEASGCNTAETATRGVWFVVLVGQGTLTIDPRGSDYEATTAIWDISNSTPTLWGCSNPGDGGRISHGTFAREYLVYVGRSGTAAGTGHTLRLAIEGTPNVLPVDDFTAPVISGLKLSPTRFKASKRGTEPILPASSKTKSGTLLSFTLSEQSEVRFAVERASTGRKVGGKCVKTTKRNRSRKRCTRYTAAGSLGARALQAGPSSLRFTGRLTKKKAFVPGKYRLRARPIDPAGNEGTAATATFTIRR
jgi:hypothetical protein